MATEPAENPLSILVRQVPGLDRANSFLKSDVSNGSMVVSKGKGTVLFEPGATCGGMLLLDRGLIRVSRTGPSGREMTLYRVSPTQICVVTLSCVLAETHYPARGVVEREIHGVLLPVSLFGRLADEVPEFRRYVFGSFTSRLAELIDLASAVTFEHLDTRLAAFLVRQCETHRAVELVLTHQDIASELGTVRERVSRLLENLEGEGLVELSRGRVRVVDCDRLRAYAAATD